MSHQTNTMNISSSSKHSSRPLSTKNLFRPIGSNHSHSRMYRSFGKSRSLCLFAYLRLELSSLVNPFWNLKPRCLWCLQTRPRINFNSLRHLLDPCFNPFDVLTSSTRIQLTGRNLPEISWSYQYLSMSLLLFLMHLYWSGSQHHSWKEPNKMSTKRPRGRNFLQKEKGAQILERPDGTARERGGIQWNHRDHMQWFIKALLFKPLTSNCRNSQSLSWHQTKH